MTACPKEKPSEPSLIEKAREVIDQAPEVRHDKVAALKEAIKKGTYRINIRQLANKLIRDLIFKKK